MIVAAVALLLMTITPGELVANLRAQFLMDGGLYAESSKSGSADGQPAFNWGVGVMLSALNAAARMDPSQISSLRQYADAAHQYWNPAGPVPGFDVQPGMRNVDRYYDDNAWMVMAYVETFELLADQRYLEWADLALAHVLSGEDSILGGGIYWHEIDKKSKNTCSNAPAVAACLAVYAHRPRPAPLAAATRLYAWSRDHLRDPKDGLMWDNIGLDGRVEKTKWSYNTALMIRAAVGLYRVTGKVHYRDDAREFGRAAVEKWVRSDGSIADEAQFAHLLFENLMILAADKTFDFAFDPTPTRAWLTGPGRSSDGFFAARWDSVPAPGKHLLLSQASAVRALTFSPR